MTITIYDTVIIDRSKICAKKLKGVDFGKVIQNWYAYRSGNEVSVSSFDLNEFIDTALTVV